ncbi:RNA-directed DNA polymerase from mobile element jockey-like protein [Willisornis vidua]|uniref:RNA-directed DNA polymerase from mobile element jockey-like protein n=1 Tax=Willisornis vidua TaxID=1566151 RepID=A0ABQ9CKX4_9PASS|nr:RNA-directed DNA polymerase from mobile element jockey-like protein [Willisornis vidua]
MWFLPEPKPNPVLSQTPPNRTPIHTLKTLAQPELKAFGVIHNPCMHLDYSGSRSYPVPRVTPILKKGKEDLGNYQTVRLTFLPGKVVEQIILEAITKHVEEKKITGCSQYRVFKGKSCLTNLIAFYDGMAGWVTRDRAVNVVYLDFNKAFYTVSHNTLIDKLRKCGLD